MDYSDAAAFESQAVQWADLFLETDAIKSILIPMYGFWFDDSAFVSVPFLPILQSLSNPRQLAGLV